MTINPNVDVGQLLVAGTMIVAAVGGYFTLKAQMASLKDALAAFGKRLDRHETVVFELSGSLQRVIGEVAAADRRAGDDRRHG